VAQFVPLLIERRGGSVPRMRRKRPLMKSQNRCLLLLIRSAMAVLLGLGLALLLNVKAVADVQLDLLQTKTDTFKDVTVTGRNQTDIFITHSKGMGNVKIKDLDAETLWKLGIGPQPAGAATTATAGAKGTPRSEPVEPAAEAASASLGGDAALAALPPELQAKIQAAAAFQEGMPDIAISAINPVFFAFVIGFVLFVHLFFSYCLKLIVDKAGGKSGWQIWVPLLQVIQSYRAAGMSELSFGAPVLVILGALLVNVKESFVTEPVSLIVGFLTLVALVALWISSIVWCFKIVAARGKSVWVAIALLLPGVNLIAFLYLAFSSGEGAASNERSLADNRNDPPVLLEA